MVPGWLLLTSLCIYLAVQIQGSAIGNCNDDDKCDGNGEPKICAKDLMVICGSDGLTYHGTCAFDSAKCKNPYLETIPCDDGGGGGATGPVSTCPPDNENTCPMEDCTHEWVANPDTGCKICQCSAHERCDLLTPSGFWFTTEDNLTCDDNGGIYTGIFTNVSECCQPFDEGPFSTCPPKNDNTCPTEDCTHEWVADPDTGCEICLCSALDVNECLNTNGGCGQICNNTVGSFTCSCSEGYTLSADKLSCTDINECLANNGGCSQICTNMDGSFNCSCKEGYSLHNNNKYCNDPCQALTPPGFWFRTKLNITCAETGGPGGTYTGIFSPGWECCQKIGEGPWTTCPPKNDNTCPTEDCTHEWVVEPGSRSGCEICLCSARERCEALTPSGFWIRPEDDLICDFNGGIYTGIFRDASEYECCQPRAEEGIVTPEPHCKWMPDCPVGCIPEFAKRPDTGCLTCRCMTTCKTDPYDLVCPSDLCVSVFETDPDTGCLYCHCETS